MGLMSVVPNLVAPEADLMGGVGCTFFHQNMSADCNDCGGEHFCNCSLSCFASADVDLDLHHTLPVCHIETMSFNCVLQ